VYDGFIEGNADGHRLILGSILSLGAELGIIEGIWEIDGFVLGTDEGIFERDGFADGSKLGTIETDG